MYKRQLQEEVKANQSKVRFLASASHDLRQPIHALSLLSSALTFQKLSHTGGEIASKIEKSVTNLSSLLEGLLDVSKLDAGIIEPEYSVFDISSLLKKICGEYSSYAQSKGLSLKLSRDVQEVYVRSDPELLERVIRNVLGNAIKYTPDGEVHVRLAISYEHIQIQIEDTGIGIAESELENIFEEFYQVGNHNRDRSHGLGLGLAIVKRIFDILGILPELKSTLGQGTAFSFKLDRAEKTNQSQLITSDQVNIRGISILSVDDEPDVLHATKLSLEGLGCKVTVASSISEARASFIENRVDVVISDVRLAHQESGIELLRELKKVDDDCVGILVSGDTTQDRFLEAQKEGIPLITKPISLELLKIEINKALLSKSS